MPPSQYPKYIRALTAYTLAEIGISRPHLAAHIWTTELATHCMVAVAARAGIWAALDRVPEHSDNVSARATRWSDSMNALIVRPGEIDDGTELWRHFLASSPGLPSHAAEVTTAISGVAPMLFLSGAALLIQAGEVYAMRYLEAEVSRHLKATLSPSAAALIGVDSRALWNTMTAAALGGYSASVIRHVAGDPAFSLGAYMRIDNDAALSNQLTTLLAKHPGATRGFPVSLSYVAPAVAADVMHSRPDDDSVSVADTEANMQNHDIFAEANSGNATPVPRPSISPEVRDELLTAIRAVPVMAPAVESIARMPPDDDTPVW